MFTATGTALHQGNTVGAKKIGSTELLPARIFFSIQYFSVKSQVGVTAQCCMGHHQGMGHGGTFPGGLHRTSRVHCAPIMALLLHISGLTPRERPTSA